MSSDLLSCSNNVDSVKPQVYLIILNKNKVFSSVICKQIMLDLNTNQHSFVMFVETYYLKETVWLTSIFPINAF